MFFGIETLIVVFHLITLHFFRSISPPLVINLTDSDAAVDASASLSLPGAGGRRDLGQGEPHQASGQPEELELEKTIEEHYLARSLEA